MKKGIVSRKKYIVLSHNNTNKKKQDLIISYVFHKEMRKIYVFRKILGTLIGIGKYFYKESLKRIKGGFY